jgi:hypothetical protein
MSRLWWIIIFVAAGVGLAILIGVLGTRGDGDSETKSEAVSALCGSLQTLESSIKDLTSLDTSTATKSEFDSDVTAVQNAWDAVKTDAQDVQDADTGDLDSAWDSFESAVKGIPNDSSVSDAESAVSSSASELESTAKSTASSVNCSS